MIRSPVGSSGEEQGPATDIQKPSGAAPERPTEEPQRCVVYDRHGNLGNECCGCHYECGESADHPVHRDPANRNYHRFVSQDDRNLTELVDAYEEYVKELDERLSEDARVVKRMLLAVIHHREIEFVREIRKPDQAETERLRGGWIQDEVGPVTPVLEPLRPEERVYRGFWVVPFS